MASEMNYSKADTAEMMAELRKRGYTTVEAREYQDMIREIRRLDELEALLRAVCNIENQKTAAKARISELVTGA